MPHVYLRSGDPNPSDVRLRDTISAELPVWRADETDLSVGLLLAKQLAVGLAVEADGAFALSLTKQLATGRANEADGAFALGLAKHLLVGLASEIDEALQPAVTIPDAVLHPRTRIRRYVVEKLIAAETEAADRVYSERVDPLQASEGWDLPAMNVFTRDERVEEWATSPRTLKRDVELAIDIIAAGTDAEDQVEGIAKDVETIIGADFRLGQKADNVILRSIETSFDGAGVQKLGVARMLFGVTYGTEVSVAPEDLLLQLHSDWNFAHPDAQKEAEDDVLFEEA